MLPTRWNRTNRNSLESALGTVGQCACYDPDPDLFDVAAAYAFYVSERQAFFDANKRTGWMAAVGFLQINGLRVTYARGLAKQWMLDLAAHKNRHALAQVMREEFEREWARENDM